MALTPSQMPELGQSAPDFQLPNVIDGKSYCLSDFYQSHTKGFLAAFVCNHCPYVVHIVDALTALCNAYLDHGINSVFISANDVATYPQDAPDKMKMLATEKGFAFPYLFDESQRTAKAYQAACTPDFFLYDGGRRLRYRGQFDSSRPGNDQPITGKDLKNAFDCLINNVYIPEEQTPSVGCNIKWRP